MQLIANVMNIYNMKAVISRLYKNDFTKGSLLVFDKHHLLLSLKTLELPYLDNKQNISCIPEGEYRCKRHISPSKGPCFSIKNVPGRENILIHAGNYVGGSQIDSEGCILIGTGFGDINYDGILDIIESRKALNILLHLKLNDFKLFII
jgi:hypothetical protein